MGGRCLHKKWRYESRVPGSCLSVRVTREHSRVSRCAHIEENVFWLKNDPYTFCKNIFCLNPTHIDLCGGPLRSAQEHPLRLPPRRRPLRDNSPRWPPSLQAGSERPGVDEQVHVSGSRRRTCQAAPLRNTQAGRATATPSQSGTTTTPAGLP